MRESRQLKTAKAKVNSQDRLARCPEGIASSSAEEQFGAILSRLDRMLWLGKIFNNLKHVQCVYRKLRLRETLATEMCVCVYVAQAELLY